MTHAAGHAFLALALLSVATPGSTSAKARPTRVSLEYTRRASARGCPSEKQLRAEVSAILGYAPFDKHARRAMSCVLWAQGDTFHARVQLKDAKTRHSLGVRELSATGPGCEALGSAVALAMALAIDPLAQPPPQRLPPPAPPAAAPPAVASGAYAGAAAAASETSRSSGAARPPPARPPPTVAAAPPTAVAAAAPEVPARSLPLPDAGAAVAALPDAGAEPPPLVAPPPDAGPESALAIVPPPAPPDAGVPEVAHAVDAGQPPAATTPVPAEPAARTVEAEPPSAPRSSHGIAGVGGDWTLGLVPSGAFGLVAHGGVVWSFASVELEARWLPNTSLASAPGSISSRLVTGALVGCAVFGDWSACGLVQAGPFTAQGHGYTPSFTTTTWVVALGARGQWDWVFAHPVGLRLHVDGLVNLVRPQLLVNAVGVWTAPPVALAVGAGVFVLF
jgi:hypothetical protein